jgi:ubiquinone/menaquinone biosynthesis C-methylase UbiE
MMRLLPLALACLAACSTPGIPPAPASEASVKPGINESFLDPELVESREVFAERHAIAGAVELEPGDRIADIGAGTGLFLEFFSAAVGADGRVYAVDIAPPFVQHLADRAASLGLDNVTATLCTERSVELQQNSIDVAFVCDTYHHFEYPASTMATIHSALARDGELVIVDFERIPGVSSDWVLGHVRAGKLEVIAELNAAGFDLVGVLELPALKDNYALRFAKR